MAVINKESICFIYWKKNQYIVAAYIYYCTVGYSSMAQIKLCKNPPKARQINLRIPEFTLQRWRSTTFKIYLALLVCGSNTFNLHNFAAYFYS